MKKKITISFIGNSVKFVKVFKSIYPNSILKCYSWRLLGNILAEQKIKSKSDVIVICGYDYSSQWYLFQKYYNYNVVYPFKFAKTISKDKTKIFIYLTTTSKFHTLLLFQPQSGVESVFFLNMYGQWSCIFLCLVHPQ